MKKVFILLLTLAMVLAFPLYGLAETTPPAAAPPIDLTPIFQALIALLAALITAKVIPWIKSKTSNEQQRAMLATVRILVFAAEQIYGAGQGDKKLAWVEASLAEQGYKLDTQMVKEMIEAQVQQLTLAQVKPPDLERR